MEDVSIDGWRGIMVHMGLGSRRARFITGALVAGMVSYATKQPRRYYRREGVDPYLILIPLAGGAIATAL